MQKIHATNLKKIWRFLGEMSLKRLVIIVVGGCLLGLAVLSHTEIRETLLAEIEAKSFFNVREILSPAELDSRVKIFSYDDRAVANLKTFDPPIKYWAYIIKALGRAGVASVTFDKLFDNMQLSREDIDKFNAILAQTSVPVFSIGFGAPEAVPYRTQLKTNWSTSGDYSKAPLMNFYGPNPGLVGLNKVGHAVYDSRGFFWSIYKDTAQELFPHISIRVGTFFGKPLPAKNKQFVNLISKKILRKATYSVLPIIRLAITGEPIPVVQPGDHVIVLPAMYTGNTDRQDSPFGTIEGGYILTSAINSALTSRWLVIIENSILFVLGGLGLAFLCHRTTLQRSIGWLVVLIISYLALVHGLFCAAGVMIPYVIPLSAVAVPYIGITVLRMQSQALREFRMKKELETAMLVQGTFFHESESACLKISVYRTSMEECSGDWWTHYSRPDGIELIGITDATGHGAPASLVTAMAYSTFHSSSLMLTGTVEQLPALIMNHMNTILNSTGKSSTSMTGIILSIDPKQESIHICNAAHLKPFKLAVESTSLLGQSNNPLGMACESNYKTHTVPFGPGERIVLLTDGVIERENPAKKMLGMLQFRKKMQEQAHLDSGQLIGWVGKFLDEYSDGVSVNDDVTLLILERSVITE